VNRRTLLMIVVVSVAAGGLTLVPADEPAASRPGNSAAKDAPPRVSLDVARDRARLMHDLYSSTLDAIHHRYFRREQPVIPARAMEDIFKDMERADYGEAKWISASFSPMSIDHEPTTDFEKRAAKQLARGESPVEIIEDGYYRHAGSILLTGGCVSCHSGTFGNVSPSAKFAGLVISIPVDEQARLPEEPKATP
jgi:hypothetical protein